MAKLSFWGKVKNKVKKWFSGGDDRRATPPAPRAVATNRDARNQTVSSRTSVPSFNKRAFLASLNDSKKEKKEEQRVQDAFKASKYSYKSIADVNKVQNERKNAREAWKKEYKSAQKELRRKTGTEVVGVSKEEREKARTRLLDPHSKFDPEATKVKVKYHPFVASAERGIASGATFGVTEFGMSRLKDPEQIEAEKYYQEHKSRGAELLGELGGSLVSFGGVGKAVEAPAARIASSELGGKAAGKLAAKKLTRYAAKRSIKKAGGEVTEDLVKAVAKRKAENVVKGLTTSALIDATAGNVMNATMASRDHEIGSKDWWKAFGNYAKFNAGVSGAVAFAPAVFAGRGIAREEILRLAQERGITEEAARKLLRGRLTVKGKANPLVRNADELFAPNVGRNVNDMIRAEDGTMLRSGEVLNATDEAVENLPRYSLNRRKRTDVVLPNERRAAAQNADEAVETAAKGTRLDEINRELDAVHNELAGNGRNLPEAERDALVKRFDDLMAERNAIEESAKPAAETTRYAEQASKAATEEASTQDIESRLAKINRELDAEYDRLARGDELPEEELSATIKRTKDLQAKKASLEEMLPDSELRAEGEQLTFDDIAEANSQAETVNANKAKAMSDEQEKAMLADVQKKREKVLDAKIRSESGGKYGFRQGEHTSTLNADIDEAMRIERDQKEVYKAVKSGDFKDLFVDESKPFAVFRTATKEDMMEASANAAKKVRQDFQGTIHRLLDLEERIIKDAETSPLLSKEHITFDDICDIVAIRKQFEEAGEKVPAEYEKAFSHIIEWQGTEAAQLNKMRHLYLMEADKGYRKLLISRDVENYLRKVLNADDKSIAQIKRSLDANYGEGYFDKMLEELSGFSGMKSDAEFRKAYAQFQKELVENSNPTGWDIVNVIRHTLMLSAPKTWGNNGLGNINMRLMYDISDAINMPTERLAQAINPDVKRTTAVLKSKDQYRLANMITSGKVGELNGRNAQYLKGFKDQDFADAINLASDSDVGDIMASSKYLGEVVRGAKFNGVKPVDKFKHVLAKGSGYGQKLVSFMLNEPDSWFVEKNYRTTLLKYLEANGVNSAETLATKEGQKIFAEARRYAIDVAEENTYKKANELVSFLEGLRKKGYVKGSNPLYKAITLTLDAEAPYLKVPVNLVINNFKYSPMGLMKGTYDAMRALSKGDAAMLNKATRELSKGLTGTGLMYLGYLMRCRNQADNDSVGFVANADDSLKEYGIKDNSIKIGQHTFNVANLGIGSTQMLMGAALGEDLDKEGVVPPYQVAFDAMAKTLDVEADMSLMENATGLLDIFGNGGDYDMKLSERLGRAGTEVAGDYISQFIPNPVRGIARGTTSADLDTGVKKGDTTSTQRIINRNLNNIVSGVPILNEKVLPHKVDTHGRLINERATAKDKALSVLNNVANPLTHTRVNIPDVDREELGVKKENGEPYKPNPFDRNRTYQAQVGTGKNKELIDLTGKEREQVARSAEYSGQDGIQNLVNKGVFGDRLGDRAQEILSQAPESDEEARALIFSTDEWKNADNARREQILDWYYGKGAHGKGVDRTRTAEAYINIAGNSEDDFRWQNDITSAYQDKYTENGLDELGITKGQWVDALEACKDTNHKWNEETQKNQDTINSAKKTKNGILSVEGLTPEQRIAIYNVIRGKRTGFGWNDWDGITVYNGGYRRRRHYGGYRHRGGGGGSKASALPKSNYKASKQTYKDIASILKTTRKGNSTRVANTVKVEPPTVKFKKYEV